MKLYVWSNPYKVSYGSSMVFAIAESLEQAKELAANSAKCYAYNEYENGRPNKAILGDPLRVVDVPCAEWHEWSE